MIHLLPMLLADDTHSDVLTNKSIDLLKTIKVFFVENVKTTRRYLSSLKLGIVIDDLTFYDVNSLTDYADLYNILINLDQDAGIISEAGCAGVADPGAFIVEVAHDINIGVKPLVGPNSILLALMASGMNGQSFVFHGYLPIKEDERIKKLRLIEKEALARKQTQIFMETPYRNNQMLVTIVKNLQGSTKLCIAADITSASEFIKTKSISRWKKEGLPDINKRPCIFLIF